MNFFNIFLIFAQNIDCGYTLEPHHWGVLTSTHNLCLGAKIKKVYPCKPQFYYIKVGCKGVFVTRLEHDEESPKNGSKFRNKITTMKFRVQLYHSVS